MSDWRGLPIYSGVKKDSEGGRRVTASRLFPGPPRIRTVAGLESRPGLSVSLAGSYRLCLTYHLCLSPALALLPSLSGPGCAKPRPEKSQAPCGTHLAVGPLPQRRSHCQGPQEEHDQGGGGGGTPREQEPRAEVRQEQLSLLVGPTLPHQTPHKYPVKHTLASPLRVMKRFSDSPKTQQAQGQG